MIGVACLTEWVNAGEEHALGGFDDSQRGR